MTSSPYRFSFRKGYKMIEKMASVQIESIEDTGISHHERMELFYTPKENKNQFRIVIFLAN